ncbi:MAG TPA: isoprenylcysteine carboxylmethyltransferase family protein [Terriglobales bacterium]|nr:isoprenylcysteine carboxylmethyltransferase family protein [Terriglobales bacterium]
MNVSNAYSILWGLFLVLWLIGSMRTKQTQERAPFGLRLSYQGPLIIGALLMVTDNLPFGQLYWHFIPRNPNIEIFALAISIAGFAFAIWARFYIGQNWSSAVTIKVGHELIRSGPYHWVRHPIYSGILLALFGMALARGKVVGLIAIFFFWLGFRIKSGIEEQFMRRTFGEEYIQYSRSTGALIPKFRT